MPASIVAVSAAVDGVAVRVGGPDCAATTTGSSAKATKVRGRKRIRIKKVLRPSTLVLGVLWLRNAKVEGPRVDVRATLRILTAIHVAACSAGSSLESQNVLPPARAARRVDCTRDRRDHLWRCVLSERCS